MTSGGKVDRRREFVSDTILRNVRVLAVDQTIDEKGDSKVALGKTATLELTESQAETLGIGASAGHDFARRCAASSIRLRRLPRDEENEHDQSINTVRFGVSTAEPAH